MKKGILAVVLVLVLVASARAQYLIRTSPIYSGTAANLVLYVSQWDQYNVTLNANTPIQFSVPVISGAIFFRLNVCENALGGFTPTFSATSTGGSAPKVSAYTASLISTNANSCSIEYWTYRQSENTLILESVSPGNVNGLVPDSLNAIAFGYLADARSVTTCSINNASPGTVTGCTGLALTASDTGHPFRAVWPAASGSNITGTGSGNLSPCIASVQDASDFTYGTMTHWTAGTTYSGGTIIDDGNGNTETGTGGTSGTTLPAPIWPTTLGGTVVDGTVTWTLTAFGSVKACQAAAYTGASESSVYVQTGTDNLWPLMNAVATSRGYTTAGDYSMRLFIPKGTGFITDTFDPYQLSGEVSGQGQLSTSVPSTSTWVWDGPRGHPIVRLRSDWGMWIHDLNLIRNSDPHNKPSAAVDLLQTAAGVNAFNRVERINSVNFQSGDPDTGNVGGTNLGIVTESTYGISFNTDSTGQNDRNQVNHFNTNQADTCFFVGQGQIDTNQIENSTCATGSDVCISDVAGGQIDFNNASCLTNGLVFDVGDGTRLALRNLTYQTVPSASQGEHIPFSIQLGRFTGSANVTLADTAQALNVSGAHSPDNGVAFDLSGVGILPVYPGPSASVVANQIIQLAPNWPNWIANEKARVPYFDQWWPSSPFSPRSIIFPVNNNAGNNYFIATVTAVPAAQVATGMTGLTEPNWDGSCGTISTTCTDAQTGRRGITWTNYGPIPPQYVIVPQVGNPLGNAYLLTTSGITGAAPPIWAQAVNQAVLDGTAIWKNIGVMPTNPGLFVFKNTAGACTTGANPPAVFSQTLNGSTTDNTCTWTTIYGSSFSSFLGTNIGSNLLNIQGATFLLGSGATGDPSSIPEAYVPLIPVGTAGQFPKNSIFATPSSGFDQPGVMRVIGGADTSGTIGRSNTIVLNRPGIAASPLGEGTSELTMGTSLFQPYRNDFSSKVNFIGGPVTILQLGAPAVPGGGTCVVPAWAANLLEANKWVIRPTAGNAGNYFFQNQGGTFCQTGSTQPAAWNQTPAGTTTDNTCTWTNVGDGSGVAAAGAAGKYYIKQTWRTGTGATPGESTASPEASINCGPTNSQIGVAVKATQPALNGADRMGIYASLATGAELLSLIARLDNNTAGPNQFLLPVSQVPANPFVASMVHLANDVMKPINNNAGGYEFVETTEYCASASSEATWTQTIGNATTDGGCSWTNVGTGVVPAANSTGNVHRTAVTVANLPANCSAGDTAVVSDWNGTNGACTGSGTTPTAATCGATNTWYCP